MVKVSALVRLSLSSTSVTLYSLTETDIDRNGNQDVLHFPPFHADILEQRHWDAGDTYGRIKIVLAEGFSRPNRSPPFERVKDIVALSFQHAPLSKYPPMKLIDFRESISTRESTLSHTDASQIYSNTPTSPGLIQTCGADGNPPSTIPTQRGIPSTKIRIYLTVTLLPRNYAFCNLLLVKLPAVRR